MFSPFRGLSLHFLYSDFRVRKLLFSMKFSVPFSLCCLCLWDHI